MNTLLRKHSAMNNYGFHIFCVLFFAAATVNGSESEDIEVDTITTVKRESREQQDSDTPHTPGLSLVGTGLSGSMNSTTGTAAARMTGDPAHIGSQVVITLTKDDSKTITKGEMVLG